MGVFTLVVTLGIGCAAIFTWAKGRSLPGDDTEAT
jgi:hypothetical protein